MTDKITLEDWNTWVKLCDNIRMWVINVPESNVSNDLYSFTIYDNTIDFSIYFTHSGCIYGITSDNQFIQVYGGNNRDYIIFKSDGIPIKLVVFPTVYQKTVNTADWRPISRNKTYLFNEEVYKYYIEKIRESIYLPNDIEGFKSNLSPFITFPILNDDKGDYIELTEDITLLFGSHLSVSRSFSIDIDINKIYEPPIISVTNPVYIGNSNPLSNVLSLPDGVDYTVYYHGKSVDTVSIPSNAVDGSSIRLKIVTKSSYPYIPSEQYVNVPVTYKYYETMEDFENFNYIIINSDITWSSTFDRNFTKDGVLLSTNNSSISKKSSTKYGKLVIHPNVEFTFKDLTMNGVIILNKGTLILDNCYLHHWVTSKAKIINEGKLIIKNSILRQTNIINNGTLILENSSCNLISAASSPDLPFIHNTGSIQTKDNNFKVLDDGYNGFNIVIIRSNDLNVNQLLENNSFEYDAVLSLNETSYTVKGQGLTYAYLDDDTIRFKDLEVSEQ